MSTPKASNKRKADVLTPHHNPRLKASNTTVDTNPIPDLSTLTFDTNDDTFSNPSRGGRGSIESELRATMPVAATDERGPAPHQRPNVASTAPSNPSTPNSVRFTNTQLITRGDIHLTRTHVLEKFSTEDRTKFEMAVAADQGYTVLFTLEGDSPISDVNMSRDVVHRLISAASGIDSPRTL